MFQKTCSDWTADDGFSRKHSWFDDVFSLPRSVRNRCVPHCGRLLASARLLGAGLLAAVSVHAQLKNKGAVEPTQAKAVLYTTSIGAAADRWDANAFDPATVQLLRDAGITNLRFPGNGGIDALYHWSTGAITKPYTNDRAPAFPREKQF